MGIVAAIQMNSTNSVEQNLARVEHWIRQAKEQGSELVVLPENFAFVGKNDLDKFAIAEHPGQGPIQNGLVRLAKQYNLWIVGGTIPINVSENTSQQRVYNRCYVWNNQGQVVAYYDKIHLFDVEVSETVYRESDASTPGKEVIAVDSSVGKLGLSVCYDIRFPELYRALLNQGAEILLVPAAFTAITGEAHWEILLRARAIENLCYVIAPDQTGRHASGRSSFGSSMIIDPWGKILNSIKTEEGVITAKIDLNYLKEIRTRFPATSHRKIL